MKIDSHKRLLTGWGLTNASYAEFVNCQTDEVAHLLARSGPRGVTMRGLGRAYGDAAQNGGGLVLSMPDESTHIHLDTANGIVRCPAGVSIDALISFLVPRGYFVPVTPGTRFVTVGGAVASDIHGKNHHRDGSFGTHVFDLTLLLADGTTVRIGPENDSDLFWATIGGMGLTGAILEATFRVIPIQTSRCTVETQRCHNLDDLLSRMAEGDESFKYSVAWTDLLATGDSMGRSILWRGEHTSTDELGPETSDPLAYSTHRLCSIPSLVPRPGLVNKTTSMIFNELWFRKAPKRRTGEIKSIPSFFHPLDSIANWNRLYGPGGFLQYQFVVPFGAEDTLRAIVGDIAAAGIATPLVVLKRFGEANAGPLSFPMPGWTLTVDIAAKVQGLSSLLARLDEQVLSAGGRHYLAKDSHLTAGAFARGYPSLEKWKSVKRRVDPQGVWTSDLARRLNLVD